MNAVIVYNVSSRINDVRNGLINNGYYAAWESNNKKYDMPDNTLWKLDVADLKVALNEIRNVITQLNLTKPPLTPDIQLTRCVVLSFLQWEAVERINP